MAKARTPASPAAPPSDLSAVARIRDAALEGFAVRGIAATSIRDVASAAGVSPGLVQHHFGTKARLREAVNDYVIERTLETFSDVADAGGSQAGWAAMGDTVTGWVRDNAIALRYVARALSEGDPGAAKIFDAVVDIARKAWLEPLAREGALDPEIDQEWAALHVVLFNLASVLYEAAISRRLPGEFFSDQELQRWNAATTELYRRGFSRRRR